MTKGMIYRTFYIKGNYKKGDIYFKAKDGAVL